MSKEGPLEVWGVQNGSTPCKRVKDAWRRGGGGAYPVVIRSITQKSVVRLSQVSKLNYAHHTFYQSMF